MDAHHSWTTCALIVEAFGQRLTRIGHAKKSRRPRSESQDIVNKQEFVKGQRKEIDVKDYAEVQSLVQILKDLEFPATKEPSVVIHFLAPWLKKF